MSLGHVTRHVIHIVCCMCVLAWSLTVPAQAASPESNQPKQDRTTRERPSSTMPSPKDCAQIKSGTADSTAESAAQKDCESSKHLGAGTGTSGVGPEGQLAAQTQLRGPRGVCFSRTGTLYIVDTSNHRVLRVSAAGLIETAAGNGAPGDAGDGGPARLAQLNQPSACALDTAGNLFIADTFSHRIRKVSPSGVIATIAGAGAAGVGGEGLTATTAALNGPPPS